MNLRFLATFRLSNVDSRPKAAPKGVQDTEAQGASSQLVRSCWVENRAVPGAAQAFPIPKPHYVRMEKNIFISQTTEERKKMAEIPDHKSVSC